MLTVRRMGFSYPDDIPTVFIEGQPEESYLNLGLSLLLPYLEPYLIRTMRAAKPRVSDPAIAKALDGFNAQEGQHYRQHARFNEVFRSRFEGLKAFEDAVAADYERFSTTKSLRWNLAFAAGFEALTSAMAISTIEFVDMSGWHPAARDLYLWHLVEELEHRTVAFDVYEHVGSGYLYRSAVSMFAQWHLLRFMQGVMKYLLRADPGAFERYGGASKHRARVAALNARSRRDLLGRWLRTYGPWYTPHTIAMPEKALALAQRFDGEAVSTS
jgi:uncharacterized protein